jgi:hypothetical protein
MNVKISNIEDSTFAINGVRVGDTDRNNRGYYSKTITLLQTDDFKLKWDGEAENSSGLYVRSPNTSSIRHDHLVTKSQLREEIDRLTEALNESRQQIQALMDFCFADRSKWKEGQGTQSHSSEGQTKENPTEIPAVIGISLAKD